MNEGIRYRLKLFALNLEGNKSKHLVGLVGMTEADIALNCGTAIERQLSNSETSLKILGIRENSDRSVFGFDLSVYLGLSNTKIDGWQEELNSKMSSNGARIGESML